MMTVEHCQLVRTTAVGRIPVSMPDNAMWLGVQEGANIHQINLLYAVPAVPGPKTVRYVWVVEDTPLGVDAQHLCVLGSFRRFITKSSIPTLGHVTVLVLGEQL